jgi:hypothetical protein
LLELYLKGKQYEQNKKSCMAKASNQSKKIRRKAQSAEGQWHRSHINSAAIIAALPFLLE